MKIGAEGEPRSRATSQQVSSAHPAVGPSNSSIDRAEAYERLPRPPLALVIPTLGSVDTVDRLLGSIRRQSVQPEQVVIVDSTPGPEIAEIAEASGYTVLRISVDRIAARLAGARATAARFICLIDSDQTLAPNFVEEVANTLSRERVEAAVVFELAEGSGKWFDLLRVQDQVEFVSGAALPRLFDRDLYLKVQSECYARSPSTHGEDRVLRSALESQNVPILEVRATAIFHRDLPLGPFVRKQVLNVWRGGTGEFGRREALGTVRGLSRLVDPRAVVRCTRSPPAILSYYAFAAIRFCAQASGLAASKLQTPPRSA